MKQVLHCVKSQHRLKVTLYNPYNSGGICHYTHQLAEHLARAGVAVTLVTLENYELQHLQRSFKLQFLFRRSWLRSFLHYAQAQLLDKVFPRGDVTPGQYVPFQQAGKQSTTCFLVTLRKWRLRRNFLKAVLSFLWHRPHIIHFQWVADPTEDYYLIVLLQLLRFKVIYTAHDVIPHEHDTPENRTAFYRIYQQVDKIIVHAKSIKKEITELFDVDKNKIYIVPHGSNDLFFNHQNLSKKVARQLLSISIEKRVILFFGLIRRYKGLEYLIEAFKDVRNSVGNVMLLIAGQIHDGEPAAFHYYSNLIGQLACCDDVMCINGYIPLEQVKNYFSAADVVVLPYIQASQSGVLLLAYAAGRPVIVTDTGGLSEVVESGRSGYVIPAKDVKALVRAITDIMQEPTLREKMGTYAKYLAETTYSWRSVARRTMDVYRSFPSGQ
jgi:glycosyltransferase involved in cell wall biosynthesis